MRWFFVGLLGVSALAGGGDLASAASKRGVRLLKKRLYRSAPRPPAARAEKADLRQADTEPIPAGEQEVYWAQPRQQRPGVKIHLSPSRGGATLGEMRGDTAIPLKADGDVQRLPGRDGCRVWLQALPEGYLCQDEVQLRHGYLSDPPSRERATAWQRFRYGVVKVASAALQHATGQPATGAGYLRGVLHRGDGVTVVRELSDRVEVYGKQWLRKVDVALVTPPALVPVNLQALPPTQRFSVAWAVPPVGETQVAIYPLRSESARERQPLWIPRYSQLFWVEGSSRSGRAAVYLSDEARAALGTRPDAQAPSGLTTEEAVEIDVAQLRRVTPVQRPSDVKSDERWIDISLSEQVAVAYAGDTPLFAALVSTGKGKTPPGSFFIYRKYLTQTMANLRGSASQYDFREVPYAQFFNGRIGLHAVLWHDLLGHPVSHGCVNMSPSAAEQFFAFTRPEMPSGWHAVNGLDQDAPAPLFRGTRVIVRR